MRLILKSFCVIFLLAIVSGCASIVSKSIWPLSVNTKPAGARIEITDIKGSVVYRGATPATVELKSSAGFFAKQSYRIKLSLNGYDEKIIPVECTINGWYFGNIIFGGLIGLLIVDPATGAMYRLERSIIDESLSGESTERQPSLKILNISDIPDDYKSELVSLK
jgi:hypothetical protein